MHRCQREKSGKDVDWFSDPPDDDFAHDLCEWHRDFGRAEPVDASAIAPAEAQEFFNALHGSMRKADRPGWPFVFGSIEHTSSTGKELQVPAAKFLRGRRYRQAR